MRSTRWAVPHVVDGITHDYVLCPMLRICPTSSTTRTTMFAIGMLRQISVDSEKVFSPLAQLVAVHVRDKVKGDHPGPFELTNQRCELAV